MAVDEVLRHQGGVASRAALVARCGRSEVDRALATGAVVAVARGRYALPEVEEATRTAHALSGTLGVTSAALGRGWRVKEVPRRPVVIVGRGRRIDPRLRATADVLHLDLRPDDVDGLVTSAEATLDHCLRRLSYDAALAVADSALREEVTPATLRRVAAGARGPGSAQVRIVAERATPLAANPFESVLRAVSHGVPGLAMVPQVTIRGCGWQHQPDLVDAELRLVAEADSFAWHGSRARLRRDARRYDELVAAGWTVLRFAWEDVMHDQEWVRGVLVDTVAHGHRPTQRPRTTRKER